MFTPPNSLGKAIGPVLYNSPPPNVYDLSFGDVTLTVYDVLVTRLVQTEPGTVGGGNFVTPTAADIIAALPCCGTGDWFWFTISVAQGQNFTLVAGAGCTTGDSSGLNGAQPPFDISGQAEPREFKCQITDNDPVTGTITFY